MSFDVRVADRKLVLRVVANALDGELDRAARATDGPFTASASVYLDGVQAVVEAFHAASGRRR